MQLVLFNNPPGRKLPKWQRTLGMSDDGNVFVPAAVTGNEMSAMLCANYDGTPIAMIHKHPFVPAAWVAKEFPEMAEACENAEARAREALAG